MTTRLVLEIAWSGDGDMPASLEALAEILMEQDGVEEVLGYGPMTTVVPHPDYAHFVSGEGWQSPGGAQ